MKQSNYEIVATSITSENKTCSHFKLWFIFVMLCFCTFKTQAQDIPQNSNCYLCQEIYTYPQLASLNTDDGKLTQLILGQLLGTQINLTTLNWEGVLQGQVSTLELLGTLQSQFNISSPNEVLNTEFQLSDIVNALAILAENDGTLVFLNQISAGIGAGTIRLSDLITVNTVNGDLIDIDFNVLTLITGMIQLYNYENVLVTNNPISLDMGSLGILTLSAQVVEPPHFGCSSSGTKYFSAGIRLKLDIDILDEVIYDAEVTIFPYTASVLATLENISLYIDVARGEMTINSINAITQQSTVGVKPGLARAFVGQIEVDDFFDRSLDPIDFLESSQIGNVEIEIIGLLSDNLALNIISYGDASNGNLTILESVPFNKVIGSSSTAISELGSDLLQNSEVSMTSEAPIVGPLLSVVEFITDDITSITNNILFETNTGKVYNLLENIVDPLLEACGIGIGEIILNSDKINEGCYDFGDAQESYKTSLGANGPRHLIASEIYLGANAPSPSLDGLPSPMADLDPNDDGLVSVSSSIINGEYQVEVNYSNMTNDSAMIVGWIDFNGDGVFDNELERSYISATPNVDPMSLGNLILMWYNLPSDADITNNFLRLRISSDDRLKNLSTASPEGILINGGVEDHFFGTQVLGLDLISFDGKGEEDHNTLHWQSQTEINFSGFEIQKSSDGKDFRKIGWIHGKSKNGENVDYEFNDSQRSGKGILYYRLRMLDLDNSYFFSKIISINQKNKSNENSILIYPNPASEVVYIDGNAEIQEVIIHDLMGANLSQHYFQDSKRVSISVSNFASGLYIIKVKNEYGIIESRRLKVK